MNTKQIDFIKNLDPDALHGTVQSTLLRNDLNMCNYEKTLEFLLNNICNERKVLLEENKKLGKILKAHSLYHLILED